MSQNFPKKAQKEAKVRTNIIFDCTKAMYGRMQNYEGRRVHLTLKSSKDFNLRL